MTASLWGVDGYFPTASVWYPGPPETPSGVCSLASLAPVSMDGGGLLLGDNFTDPDETLATEHVMDVSPSTPWTSFEPEYQGFVLYDGSLVSPEVSAIRGIYALQDNPAASYEVNSISHVAVFTEDPFTCALEVYVGTGDDSGALTLTFSRAELGGPISVLPHYFLTSYGNGDLEALTMPTCTWVEIEINLLLDLGNDLRRASFTVNGVERFIEFSEDFWNLFTVNSVGIQFTCTNTPSRGFRIADTALYMPSLG